MADTLSVEAVNQMRKAMGLPLIPVPGSGLEFAQESKEDVPENEMTLDERQERGHTNFAKLQEEQQKKKEREDRKNKLKREREMAARNAVLKGSGIAEVEDDLGATDWLKSMNKRRKVIDTAEQARLDAEARRVAAVYDSKDLAGIKVAHQAGDFDEDAVLTFKDRGIDEGDSDEEFELENRELVQKEELAKRLKAKKFKPGAVYNPNEDQNGMLSQYDEAQGSTFTLDASGQAAERKAEVEAQDGARSKGVVVSLDSLLNEKIESDYREAKAVKPVKPKKVKKSKNARKRARDEEDDIFPTNGTMDVDIPHVAAPKAKKRNTDDFTFEDDEDMAAQLAAARRKALKARKKPADIAREIKEQEENEMQDVQETTEGGEEGGLLIDASTEWANSLDPEAMAREAAEEEDRRRKREASHHTPKPEPVEEDEDVKMSYAEAEEAEEAAARAARTPSEAPPDDDEDRNIGDEEAIGGGLGATLKMLKDRNLVEANESSSTSWASKQKFLQQRAAREEDAEIRAKRARLLERERTSNLSARDREEAARQANSARDYNESRALADLFNKEYKPNVELKYHDEFGNSLTQKEAFKELSHQFHGKGSGKQKMEKRLKKLEEEKKRMSSNMLDASQFAAGGEGGKKKNKTAGVRLQ